MLFGILGRARNGKSTAANIIESRAIRAGCPTLFFDIGEMVRRYCVLSGLLANKTRDQLTASELQILVDEGKRQRDRDRQFWIKKIEFEYLDRIYESPNLVCVIPNVRYLNEVDLVKSLGGKTIRSTILNEDGSPYISPDRDPNHISETELLNVPADYYITVKQGDKQLAEQMAALIFYDALRKEKGK